MFHTCHKFNHIRTCRFLLFKKSRLSEKWEYSTGTASKIHKDASNEIQSETTSRKQRVLEQNNRVKTYFFFDWYLRFVRLKEAE